MGLIRLIIVGFVVLTLIYFAASIYSGSVRREKLEKRWDKDHPNEGETEARTTYIEEGMAAYRSGLRRRLLLLIYVVPAIFVVTALILTN